VSPYNEPYPCPLCGREVHRGGRIVMGYRFHRRCAQRFAGAVHRGRAINLPAFLQISGAEGGTIVANSLGAREGDEL